MFLFHLDNEDIDSITFFKNYIKLFDDSRDLNNSKPTIICNRDKNTLIHLNDLLDKTKYFNIITYTTENDISNHLNKINALFIFYNPKFEYIWKDKLQFVQFKILGKESSIKKIIDNKDVDNMSSNKYNIYLLNDMSYLENNEKETYIKGHTFFKKDDNMYIDIDNIKEEDYIKFEREVLKYNRTFGLIQNIRESLKNSNQHQMILYRGNYEINNPVFKLYEIEEVTSEKEKNEIKKEEICHHTYKGNNEYKSNKDILKDDIRVCLIGDWIESEKLIELWKRYCKDGYKWDNIILVNEKEINIDYYIVINRPNFINKNTKIDSNKILFFHMEPNMIFTPWYKEFLNYFESKDLLFNGKHLYHRNNVDWHLSKDYSYFMNNNKFDKIYNNKLSMVLSSRRENTGHQMRLTLAHRLDKEEDIEVNIYGKCDKENFRNYKYELEYYSRDEAIIPYKYHFMAENNSINNYMTEKIIDCILGETLCFYYGCPNLETFIDKECYIRLPLYDTEKSLQIIKESILNNEWEKRIDKIRTEKYKLLNIYSLLPRVKTILKLNLNTKIILITKMKDINKIKEFSDILEEQSFKNINVIIIDNIMDKIVDLIKYVIKENKDCLFINHDRYIREDYKQDNLIYERICDTMTDVINDNKIENFIVFNREEEGKNLINKDFYISNKKSKELISIIDNVELRGNNEELLRKLNESIYYKNYLYN